jgi:hypothetical protein
MSIKSDYDEILNTFGKIGPLGKLFLIISLFFSVSSITSLADKIFEWKGFIQAALTAYRSYFVNPITSSASNIGLTYSPNEIHAAVLGSISISIGMRLMAAGQSVAFNIINEKYRSELKPNLLFYWIAGTLFPIGIWLWYGLSIRTPNILLATLSFLTYPIIIVITKIIIDKFIFQGGYLEKDSFSYLRSYYSYVLTVFLIVGIFGAINAGYTRTN